MSCRQTLLFQGQFFTRVDFAADMQQPSLHDFHHRLARTHGKLAESASISRRQLIKDFFGDEVFVSHSVFDFVEHTYSTL